MSFWVFGGERHSFFGGLTGREKVDLGSLLSRSGMKRPVCLKVFFESVGDETPGGLVSQSNTPQQLSFELGV